MKTFDQTLAGDYFVGLMILLGFLIVQFIDYIH